MGGPVACGPFGVREFLRLSFKRFVSYPKIIQQRRWTGTKIKLNTNETGASPAWDHHTARLQRQFDPFCTGVWSCAMNPITLHHLFPQRQERIPKLAGHSFSPTAVTICTKFLQSQFGFRAFQAPLGSLPGRFQAVLRTALDPQNSKSASFYKVFAHVF